MSKLISIPVPEIDRFPAESREEMLRRCVESADMKKLKLRWATCATPTAVITGTCVAFTSGFLRGHPATIAAAGVAGFVVSYLVVNVVKLVAEYRLVRQLLRAALRNGCGDA